MKRKARAVFFYRASKDQLVRCATGGEYVTYPEERWEMQKEYDLKASDYGDYIYVCVEHEYEE